jgi:hypothetical protein
MQELRRMMFSRKELKFVYGLAVVLLVLAVVSYAAFSAKPPKRPLRMVFQSVAGKVLFDHERHAADRGYGLSCGECHHTLEPDEYEDAQSCSACHDPEQGDEDMLKRSDAIHKQCIDCHKDYGAGPVDCSECHVMM